MAKAKKCELVCLSHFGIVTNRVQCASLAEAKRKAKQLNTPRFKITDEFGKEINI